MFLRLMLTLVVLLTIVSILPATPSENPMLVRVDLLDKADMSRLIRLHFDIPYVTENFAEAVVYPEDLSKLDKAGLHYQVVHEDLTSFYQSRYPLTLDMGGFLTYPEILDTIDALHANFPDLVSARDSIGGTWEGRGLWVFKISDNVDIDEDEPEVFYNSLIHAREPASWSWQLHYINWLLENYGSDPVATEIIDNREIYFLPVFNPDGYEYNRLIEPDGGGMWRKNRRDNGGGIYGVDLNRNWSYMWGYDDNGSSPDSNSEVYRGPLAFSEPETQAVRDFIISRDFQFIVNAHTFGDYFLYSWGYDDIYTPDHNVFRAMGDSAEALTDYTPGTAWEILYNVNGDANDWQYGEQMEKPLIFCAVTESGTWNDNFWPDPQRIPQINAQMLPLAIFISQIAENVRSLAAPFPPVLDSIGEVNTDTFTVSWTHEDEDNPAVAFELVEKTSYSRITDDFEDGDDNWLLNGFYLRTNRYHSPSHSLFSGNENSYHGEAILAEPFTVQSGDTLFFYTWYNIEDDWDYAYVELSTDGGQTFFTIEGNITTNYDPYGNNHGNGITGSSGGWVEAIFPLDEYIDSTVVLKFSYITDRWVIEDGIYFDDVYPVSFFEQTLVISSDITDNFYLIEGRENGTYYYQVRAKDGQNQWSGFSNRQQAQVEIEVWLSDKSEVPTDFSLKQNYPNPFNSRTEIAFSLASPGFVKFEIYDITGKLVSTLIDGRMKAGNHLVIWDGKNNRGENVASGIYLYKLSSKDRSLMQKMVLTK